MIAPTPQHCPFCTAEAFWIAQKESMSTFSGGIDLYKVPFLPWKCQALVRCSQKLTQMAALKTQEALCSKGRFPQPCRRRTPIGPTQERSQAVPPPAEAERTELIPVVGAANRATLFEGASRLVGKENRRENPQFWGVP